MTPVVPMLAQVASDVDEALETLDGDVAFEWKMDGARIQLHKQNDLVRIFTRNLNDVTAAIPEIAAAARSLPTKQLVLDGGMVVGGSGGGVTVVHSFGKTKFGLFDHHTLSPVESTSLNSRVLVGASPLMSKENS